MAGADRKLSRCKATLAVGLCAALLAQVAPLGAQSDDENARRHFESGAAYLQQSDNENALREFQAAYSLSKRPALLLNIANVYERMGKPKEAVEALTKYLAEDPKATDRTTQETRIANLKKRAESGETTPPPAASASAAPAPSAPQPPTSSTPPPMVETPKPARSPNRTPAYIALGVGGATAIGAVVTGIIAKSKFDKADKGSASCRPCTDSQIAPIKTMALVSTILTGVAVVSVGVGGVLFFTAKPPASDSASVRPSLDAGFEPGGGKVEATWHF
jgi:Tetratricopeptide repeat